MSGGFSQQFSRLKKIISCGENIALLQELMSTVDSPIPTLWKWARRARLENMRFMIRLSLCSMEEMCTTEGESLASKFEEKTGRRNINRIMFLGDG